MEDWFHKTDIDGFNLVCKCLHVGFLRREKRLMDMGRYLESDEL